MKNPAIVPASLTHPGRILCDEFFEPLGVTPLAAAKAAGIPQSRLIPVRVKDETRRAAR